MLVREFAHDTSTVNTAKQSVRGPQNLIPTLFEHCEDREDSLQQISEPHNVSEAEVKVLPTISIICCYD